MDAPAELDPLEHEAEVGSMPQEAALNAWSHWKDNPGPERMAAALRSVRPIIDKSVSRFSRYNAAIMGGEAKRLAIAAIKTYDPSQGTKLSTHVYNHLRPMGRHAADLGAAARKSRLDRERTAEYLSAVRDLTETNNREPSDDELRDHLKVDRKTLSKMRQASGGEAAEGQMEYLPGEDEDPRLALWTDYVYHDLDPTGKLIMDHKLGRNGRPVLNTEATADRLGLHPDYVNRRAGQIAERILSGANGYK
jgi:hypothetical protein